MSTYSGPQPWTEEGKPSVARRNRDHRKTLARYAWRTETPAWVLDAGKPWKAPRSAKPYVQKPMQPGARITWSELAETGQTHTDEEFVNHRTGQRYPERTYPVRQSIERSGEIWSLGGWDRSVWVIPDLPGRDELAVLLTSRKYGDFDVRQTYPRTHREDR